MLQIYRNTIVNKMKKAIRQHHHKEIQEIKGMKKLDPVNKDDFLELQEYFMDKSLENGRTAFKIRTQMLEDIPGNFKNKFKNGKKTN